MRSTTLKFRFTSLKDRVVSRVEQYVEYVEAKGRQVAVAVGIGIGSAVGTDLVVSRPAHAVMTFDTTAAIANIDSAGTAVLGVVLAVVAVKVGLSLFTSKAR